MIAGTVQKVAGAVGAHDRQRGHRHAGTYGAQHRLCGLQQLAMGSTWAARVAISSAGARECRRGASDLQCMSRLCRAGCMVPIWGFRCALYMYMSIAVRVLKLA